MRQYCAQVRIKPEEWMQVFENLAVSFETTGHTISELMNETQELVYQAVRQHQCLAEPGLNGAGKRAA